MTTESFKESLVYCQKGIALCEAEKYEESIVAFDEALKLDSDNAEAWCKKSVALVRFGRYEESLNVYDKH